MTTTTAASPVIVLGQRFSPFAQFKALFFRAVSAVKIPNSDRRGISLGVTAAYRFPWGSTSIVSAKRLPFVAPAVDICSTGT